MYLVKLKTLLTEALRTTFDSEYPIPDFRNIKIDIEFPVDQQDYPGIWVDFEPQGDLSIVGVDHREYDPASNLSSRRYTRWKFAGHATYTIAALTSLARDRLYDEVIRVMAFGKEAAQTSEFRSYIEDNEFLAVNFNFDTIGTRGIGSSPGTPWGTDEMIYEITVDMGCFGEFVSDGLTQTLVPISEIVVYPFSDLESDPVPNDGWQ